MTAIIDPIPVAIPCCETDHADFRHGVKIADRFLDLSGSDQVAARYLSE